MKTMKKILVVLSACLMSSLMFLTLFTFAGCQQTAQSSSSSSQQQEEIMASIAFSTKEKTLTVGDEEYLIPEYKKLDGYTLTYVSSDSSVVEVNGDGKVSAVGEGSAVVKATYSNGSDTAEASMTINSSFGGYLPELRTMGVSDEIAITVSERYQVLPYVMFNGKQFKDVDVTYTVLNEAVASVNEKGEIIAKAKGETDVILEAAWRGKETADTPTLQKVVSLSVVNDVKFYNNNESITDEVLYTFAEFEGQSYKNQIPCKFTVKVNGVEVPASFTIENQDVVKQQGDFIVVNGVGATNVLVQKTVDDTTYTKTFAISVKRIEKTVSGIVPLFNTVDGKYLDAESGQRKELLTLVNDLDAIVDAYQGARALQIDGGKIFGVESSSQTRRGEAEISVGTSKLVYHFTLETLAKALSTKADIKALELSDRKVLNGYYELLNDIDAAGVTLNHVVTNDACFSGVFNGNGYSINNLSLNANSSLFGVLSSTAIVKNFALINLNATKSYFLAQNTLNDGLTITDVYIALSASTVTPRGLTGRTGASSVYKNIVIEYLGVNAAANRNYQDRYVWQGLIGGLWTYESNGMLYAQDKKWSNVYVISPFVVSFRSDEKKDGSNYAALYGYGANETKDIYGNALNTITHDRDNPNLGEYWQTTLYYDAVFTNLNRYNSYAELKAQKPDYSEFNSDYWVVSDHQIIWKSVFAKDMEIKFFDGNTDLGSDAKLIGLNKELSVRAFFDGVELHDIEVSVADNNYVVYDSAKQTVKLVSVPREGAANVQMDVSVAVGKNKVTKSVSLMVVGDLIVVAKTYDLIDESTGKAAGKAFSMSEIVGNEEILSIYQGSKRVTYDQAQGTLTGLTANIVGSGETREVQPVELTINTQNKVYIVKLKVYSKVITTAKDLQYFNQTLSGNAHNSYDGYYILANSVEDFSGVYNNAPDNNHGLKPFTGTFDGNGYSVSAKVNKGLFGVLGHGAVIKNLAFTDMQVTVEDAYTCTAIIAGYISNSTDVAVVKDVYISIDETLKQPYRQYLSVWFTTAMLVSNNASLKSKFANIVIEANILHSDYNAKGGAQPCLFRYWNGIDEAAKGGEYAKNTVADALTNVYVISKDKTNQGGLFRITAGIGRATNKSMALSYNDYMVVANGTDAYTTLYLPNTYQSGNQDLVTLRRYDDYSAMVNDRNDYSLFNATCWNLTGTTPVWKNK